MLGLSASAAASYAEGDWVEKVQDSASMNRALQLSCTLMLAPLLQQPPQLVAETKTMSLSNAAKLTGGADEEVVSLLFRA